jgi:hypothetical protein
MVVQQGDVRPTPFSRRALISRDALAATQPLLDAILRKACAFLHGVLRSASHAHPVPGATRRLHEETRIMNGWTMGLEGWLWMGVWALVVIGLVWLLVREPHRSQLDDAAATLRSRLARGEITPDEFERARRLLES